MEEEGSLSLPFPSLLMKITKSTASQMQAETPKLRNSLFFRDFQENLLNCYQAHWE